MQKQQTIWTMNRLILTALLFRLILVFYARIHDYIFEVIFIIKKNLL